MLLRFKNYALPKKNIIFSLEQEGNKSCC